MTRFWHRRICEGAFFIGCVVIALYFLPYVMALGSISDSLIITDLGVALAALTLVLSFVLYLWTPRKYLLAGSLTVYFLLAATSAVLIHSTGDTRSPFIALWITISVFASVFGFWGIVPMLFAVAGFEAYTILSNPSVFPTSAVTIIAIGGLTPLIASYIIFHSKPNKQSKDDLAYHELTTELTQQTNKASTVIQAIDEGVIALNAKGTIELINPAAEHIIGWGGSDAIGLDYKSVLKLTDKADVALTDGNDPVIHVLTTNKDIHSKDFYTTTSSGKRMILSIVVSPVGQLGEGVIIVFRDITKEQAEEREQAEFISTASHEMRTPVASIEGYLGLALNPNTAQIDEKARDFIEKAHQSAEHLGRLFQDLLDVSKAEDGRLSNHPNIVDVVSFIGDVADGLRPKAEEKQLRLFFKPNPDSSVEQVNLSPLFYVNVDNDHLRELVANLIENAIKYTPAGDIIVDIDGDDDHVKISVQDSGIGIPKEDISHLFQKFYRVDNTATREIGGTGLGLYLCRRLAEVMGGRIWVDSEFQKGSTFYLELPRIDREEALHMIDAAASPIEVHATDIDTATTASATTDQQIAIENGPIDTTTPITPPQSIPMQPSTPSATPQPVSATPITVAQPVVAPAVIAAAPTLESIEQNPSQYTQNRTQIPVTVPSRQPGQ